MYCRVGAYNITNNNKHNVSKNLVISFALAAIMSACVFSASLLEACIPAIEGKSSSGRYKTLPCCCNYIVSSSRLYYAYTSTSTIADQTSPERKNLTG
jgi:hypothetical protein